MSDPFGVIDTVLAGAICLYAIRVACQNRKLLRENGDLKFTNDALRRGCEYWQKKASPPVTYYHPLHHPTRWVTWADVTGDPSIAGMEEVQ